MMIETKTSDERARGVETLPVITQKWQYEVTRQRDDSIIPNIPNATLILELDSRWQGVLAYNKFERRVFVRKNLPSEEASQELLLEERPLTNHDLTHVQHWLQNWGQIYMLGKDATESAVNMIAMKNSYHPIHEWLNSLPEWDGVPRVENWLTDIFGAEDGIYTQLVGKMFLLGMYRRIMQPGIKMDYMLILEGDQGLRKSTACEVLAGGLGFGVAEFKELSSVDTSIFLRNKWIIEFGEMHALRKAEVNELKLWLVKQAEDYRPKYGKVNEVEPRQCVFIGTSNNSNYLNDPTGNRRFWPIHCTKSDVEKLLAIREMLWAEIRTLDAAGELHYPENDVERLYFVPQQRARMITDAWDFMFFPRCMKMKVMPFTTALSWIGIQHRQVDNLVRTRLDNIFSAHGWIKGKNNAGVCWRPPSVGTDT